MDMARRLGLPLCLFISCITVNEVYSSYEGTYQKLLIVSDQSPPELHAASVHCSTLGQCLSSCIREACPGFALQEQSDGTYVYVAISFGLLPGGEWTLYRRVGVQGKSTICSVQMAVGSFSGGHH